MIEKKTKKLKEKDSKANLITVKFALGNILRKHCNFRKTSTGTI